MKSHNGSKKAGLKCKSKKRKKRREKKKKKSSECNAQGTSGIS